MEITIIHAKVSSNNNIVTLRKLDKNYILSAGCLGFSKAKRASSQAAQLLGEKVGELLQSNNIDKIIIIFNGVGKGRRSIIKGFVKKNIRIVKIIDKTKISHNGCRSKKKRRI